MAVAEVYLKWHQTFLFLFQTILTVADTSTDIWTSLTYRQQGHRQWFAVSLGVTIITMAVLCVWSIIASTSRALSEEQDDSETGNPDVIFRHTRINLLLGCLCVGPPLHSFQMFLVCASRFKELWKSENGLRIDNERLYYLYVHTLNLKMVEGLIESAPQLIIQVYVMLVENKDVELIQKISAPISFLSLTWMITSMEVFREFANYNMKLLHNLVIFISNVGIIAARTVAIICFTFAFPWWFFLVFGVHCLIINAIGCILWRSDRKQDILVFIFAYSPLYLFIYSSYYLTKLRGIASFSFAQRLGVATLWHVLFTAENIAMILGYYFVHAGDTQWFTIPALVVVIIGNVGGILLKVLSLYCCFAEKDLQHTTNNRPTTIRVVQTKNRA